MHTNIPTSRIWYCNKNTETNDIGTVETLNCSPFLFRSSNERVLQLIYSENYNKKKGACFQMSISKQILAFHYSSGKRRVSPNHRGGSNPDPPNKNYKLRN